MVSFKRKGFRKPSQTLLLGHLKEVYDVFEETKENRRTSDHDVRLNKAIVGIIEQFSLFQGQKERSLGSRIMDGITAQFIYQNGFEAVGNGIDHTVDKINELPTFSELEQIILTVLFSS